MNGEKMTNDEQIKFINDLAAAILEQSKKQMAIINGLKNPLNEIEQKEKEPTDKKAWFLKFTDKEISKMQKRYQNLFRVGRLRAYIREKKHEKTVTYEARCRMDGIIISAGGRTKEEAKLRFIEKLNKSEIKEKKPPVLLGDFIKFYFETFRKRKVTESTYKKDVDRVKKHILPALGNLRLSAITPSICQSFIDTFSDKGKTAEELFSLLSQTFKCAIAHHLIEFSPLDTVLRPKHDRENGKALTREQEARLLSAAPERYKEAFAIAIYTGIRPNEYKTIRREGDFLIAKNSKQKGTKVNYKKIPVSPMLRPYLSDAPSMPTARTLWNVFKKIFPDMTLYDLRTTFHTRCVECHVDDNARRLMMGHSLGRLANAYTDVSNEFLKAESEKICYDLPKV